MEAEIASLSDLRARFKQNETQKKKKEKKRFKIWIENIFNESRLSNVDEFFWENK